MLSMLSFIPLWAPYQPHHTVPIVHAFHFSPSTFRIPRRSRSRPRPLSSLLSRPFARLSGARPVGDEHGPAEPDGPRPRQRPRHDEGLGGEQFHLGRCRAPGAGLKTRDDGGRRGDLRMAEAKGGAPRV